jgi:hypothetical protein
MNRHLSHEVSQPVMMITPQCRRHCAAAHRQRSAGWLILLPDITDWLRPQLASDYAITDMLCADSAAFHYC